MIDMFGQELHPGDVAFLLDGRYREVGVVSVVKENSVKVGTSAYEDGTIYSTTKRSPDRIIKLTGVQIAGYRAKNEYYDKKIKNLEDYYASKGYQ